MYHKMHIFFLKSYFPQWRDDMCECERSFFPIRLTQLKSTVVIHVSPNSLHDDGVLFLLFWFFYVRFVLLIIIGYIRIHRIDFLFSFMIYNHNPFKNIPNKLESTQECSRIKISIWINILISFLPKLFENLKCWFRSFCCCFKMMKIVMVKYIDSRI